MKKTLTLLGLTIFILGGCEQIDGFLNDKKKAKQTPQMMPPQMVQIAVAQKQTVPLSFTYPARIVSNEDVKVLSRVSGVVTKKYFKAGQKVQKGDLLYSIDPEVYKARYNVALASLQVAQASLSQAKKEFIRTKSLFKKQATSAKSFDNANANYQKAKASVAQAKASKDSTKIELDYTNVYAPFDGVVGDGIVNVGAFVTPNTPLVRVTKANPVYAEFFIPDVEGFNYNKKKENDIWSRQNSHAVISYAGKKVDGKLVFIDKIIDATNGSVKAKAIIDNKNNDLPVGSFAKITIDGISALDAFKVASIALQQDLATTFLYVVKPLPKEEIEKMPKGMPSYMYPSGTVKIVPIKIEYQTNSFILTTKGLKQGDQIIMNNFKKIYPGAKIKVVGMYGQTMPQKAKKSIPKNSEKK